VNIPPFTVGFIVDPLPIVDVTVYVDELSLAVGPVVYPFADVFCPVGPILLPVAVAETALPRTFVCGAGRESVERAVFSLLIGIPFYAGSDGFPGLFLSEVLATANLIGPHETSLFPALVSSPERLNLRYRTDF